jgi:raffinose/stachyose/melibiose transport system permease protein
MGQLKFHRLIILFLLPALTLYGLFFAYPFVQTAVKSMTTWDGFGTPQFVGLGNFVELLRDKIFVAGMKRVGIWAVLSIIFKVGTAFVLAVMLRKPIPGARFFRALIFLPFVLSAASVSLMFIVMYDKDIGLFNQILRVVGLGKIARPWLADENFAFYAVIAVPIWQAIGYFFIIFLAAIQDIPEELYEAGIIDGAGALNSFYHITIPLMWPVLQAGFIMAINGALQNFDYVFIMTNGGPASASEVPATYMYRSLFYMMRYGYGTAIAVSIFLTTFLLAVIIRQFLKTRVEY